MYGSDAKNSFEPNEFKFLVDEIRKLDQALQNQVDKNTLTVILVKEVTSKMLLHPKISAKDK